jgi:hypothetical protein
MGKFGRKEVCKIMADKTKTVDDLLKNVNLPEEGRFGKTSLANLAKSLKYGQLSLFRDLMVGDPKIVKEFVTILDNSVNDYQYR